MSEPVAQHAARRSAARPLSFFIVIEIVIEKILNLLRAGQTFESRNLFSIESVIILHAPTVIRSAGPEGQTVPLPANYRTSARSSSKPPRDNVHRMPPLTGRWRRLYYPVRLGLSPDRMVRDHDWECRFAAAQEFSALQRGLRRLPRHNRARLLSMLLAPQSVRSLF